MLHLALLQTLAHPEEVSSCWCSSFFLKLISEVIRYLNNYIIACIRVSETCKGSISLMQNLSIICKQKLKVGDKALNLSATAGRGQLTAFRTLPICQTGHCIFCEMLIFLTLLLAT